MRLYDGHLKEYRFEETAEQIERVLMIGGVLCWVVRNSIQNWQENCQSEREKLHFVDELGLWASITIIAAPHGRPPTTGERYMPNHDNVYVFSKKAPPKVSEPIRDVPNRIAGSRYPTNSDVQSEWHERPVSSSVDCEVAPFGYRDTIWRYLSGGMKTATDISPRTTMRRCRKVLQKT